MNLNLAGTNSRGDFLIKVKTRVTQTAKGKWITGRGWIETFWKPPQFPTRQDLDKIAPDNPVFLTRADGHASVANSATLKIAKIDKDTPNPFGGEILKDKQTGEPTGMLTDNAQELVRKNIPKPAPAEREQALLTGINREIGLGWCEIQNAGSSFGNRMAANPEGDVDLIKKVYGEGKGKIRLVNCVYGPGEDAQNFLKEGATIDAFNHHFTQRTIKVIFDGALGSRGAALLDPYADDAKNTGLLKSTPDHLRDVSTRALEHGFQVATHAIGDRGNRVALDAYQAALDKVPTVDHRFRIEHVQVLDHADIPRFAQLGVIPSMQAVHQTSDMYWAATRLGPSHVLGAYAWRSLLQTGVIVPNGSDFPVERVNPLYSFHAAVSRQDEHDWPPGGWYPEQRMTRDEALKSMTIWPAYAGFQERVMGSLTPGKLADFDVLDRDIMVVPAPEILGTQVLATYIGGRAVYERGR
jgi:predicted amidohydrolase YtcJ